MVVSEVLIGLLKGIYGRARPPGPLVATSGAAFPSGHAVAASVTAVAAVIALVPAGRRRAWWAAAGAHQSGDRKDHDGMTGGKAQPAGSLTTQDHARYRLRRPAALHERLGDGLQRYLQQGRRRQRSGQAQPPQQRGRGGHQGKSPDHSRQLDCPHWRIQPPGQ